MDIPVNNKGYKLFILIIDTHINILAKEFSSNNQWTFI